MHPHNIPGPNTSLPPEQSSLNEQTTYVWSPAPNNISSTPLFDMLSNMQAGTPCEERDITELGGPTIGSEARHLGSPEMDTITNWDPLQFPESTILNVGHDTFDEILLSPPSSIRTGFNLFETAANPQTESLTSSEFQCSGINVPGNIFNSPGTKTSATAVVPSNVNLEQRKPSTKNNKSATSTKKKRVNRNWDALAGYGAENEAKLEKMTSKTWKIGIDSNIEEFFDDANAYGESCKTYVREKSKRARLDYGRMNAKEKRNERSRLEAVVHKIKVRQIMGAYKDIIWDMSNRFYIIELVRHLSNANHIIEWVRDYAEKWEKRERARLYDEVQYHRVGYQKSEQSKLGVLIESRLAKKKVKKLKKGYRLAMRHLADIVPTFVISTFDNGRQLKSVSDVSDWAADYVRTCVIYERIRLRKDIPFFRRGDISIHRPFIDTKEEWTRRREHVDARTERVTQESLLKAYGMAIKYLAGVIRERRNSAAESY